VDEAVRRDAPGVATFAGSHVKSINVGRYVGGFVVQGPSVHGTV
jgi:hypothetical protein